MGNFLDTSSLLEQWLETHKLLMSNAVVKTISEPKHVLEIPDDVECFNAYGERGHMETCRREIHGNWTIVRFWISNENSEVFVPVGYGFKPDLYFMKCGS